ncbi:MAG TPA: hypothetical protein VHX13_01395 [Acidobacteriaceae bacterium]|jgi:hypothetical protein|nr:hypothetical protein [Acidobacteriaceae bacterium]
MRLSTQTASRKAQPSPWLFPFTHWNWKVALLTAVLRGGACVAALRHVEVHARRHFGVVEAAFVLLTCGFFSALQQQSLSLRTERLAWLACVVVVPLTSLGMDAGLHFWLDGRRTQQLGMPALAFTLISATFHWHMIRNGALLVGEEAHTLATDLRRIPRLMASYCMAPVAWVSGLFAVRGSEPGAALEAASSGGPSL